MSQQQQQQQQQPRKQPTAPSTTTLSSYLGEATFYSDCWPIAVDGHSITTKWRS